MKRRKFLLGSSAALAGGSFITGSGAFSSAQAERSVNIDVVGDENAYLRLLYSDESQSIQCDEEIHLVDVQNWTGSELTSVTISISSSPENLRVDLDEEQFKLDEDELKSIAVSAQTTEGSSGDGEIEFDVTARGDGIHIQTTKSRSVDVEWDCPAEESDGE